MGKTLPLLVILLLFIQPVPSAKILLASMPQGRSHTGSFMALINEIKRQGHEIWLYMEAYPNRTNPFASNEFETFQWRHDFDATSQMFPFFYGAKSCDIMLQDHRDYFYEMVGEHFDLILTDTLFAVCAYGFTSLNKVNSFLSFAKFLE
ncbi:hypothetical protein OESDEN_20733 [Oesophagostomum dentatum]|uniref:Glucuronosyltransferase n=1 Tax=Oesophagostomum dentatum TaxID=61180 RepID=A0A0B1S8T6_OESDE|nr:hypothetical protein OESDEN_20733 [Oesophagostomum dentatum]